MADTYHSWTLPFVENEIPIDLTPADGSLLEPVADAMGEPGVMMTMSRRDWLHGGLTNVFAAFGGSALAFLVKDPKSAPGDYRIGSWQPFGTARVRVRERWLVTALRHSEIPDALAEIDSWLTVAASHPERFVEPLATNDIDWIAQGLRESVDMTQSGFSHDPDDEPPYFFSFLKGLRSLLLDAHARRLAVLHVRLVRIFFYPTV